MSESFKQATRLEATEGPDTWINRHIASGNASADFVVRNKILNAVEKLSQIPPEMRGLSHFKEIASYAQMTDEERAHLFARADIIFSKIGKP